jgi:hypothetical protein
MQDKTITAFLHAIKVIRSDVEFLYKQTFLLRAQIEALKDYSLNRISKLDSTERDAAFKEIADLTRLSYDRIINRLEDIQPAAAAEFDLRGSLPSDEEAFWRLVSEEFPKKDEQPPGESGG